MGLLDSLKQVATEIVEEIISEQSLYDVFPKEEADRIREERLSICETCTHRVNGLCGVCLCIIEIKTKTFTNKTVTGKIVSTNCDKQKWPKIQLS